MIDLIIEIQIDIACLLDEVMDEDTKNSLEAVQIKLDALFDLFEASQC